MKNNSLKFLFISLFIASCGGGGGSSPLILTVQQFSSFSVNEDDTYQTVISSSTNKPATITYTISKPSANANVTISNSGALFYSPKPNYFGSDNFSITVIATPEGNTGSYESTTFNVIASVISVNDPPEITVNDDLSIYNENTLIFDDTLSINVTISDIDNILSELSVYGTIEGQTFSGIFTEDLSIPGAGNAAINISSNLYAGLNPMDICVTDGTDSSCGGQIQAYFPGSKEIKSVDYCDSTGNNCSSSDQYLYYLVGGPNTEARTNYLFIGDQLNGESGRDSFHEALLSSVNLLMSSDASDFIDGYFNIIVLEEVDLTGVSIFDIRTGCYASWDASIYCIGEVDRSFMTEVVPNWTVASFLTSISGRGVAQGSVNIQPISSRSRNVVMHELGHSHAYMGDEYDSGGERTFVEWYGNWAVNTSTVNDPNLVKWNHHIDFTQDIPGVDYDICYNYSDGTIYYRDELSYEECECYMNQYPDNDEYNGFNADDGCKDRVGLLEGTYYGEIDNYRPKWWSIMWCCTLEYGVVNIDGFAVGSIMNQGFRDYAVNGVDGYGDLTNQTAIGDTVTLSVDAIYDQSKLKLKWFIDGIEQTQYENQTSVTFERPNDNSWKSYSYIAEDLTANLFAPNDLSDASDFYEGAFERSYYYQTDSSLTPIASSWPYIGSFEWYDPNNGWFTDESVDSSNMDNFLFAAACCSMGTTFKINWSKYQQTSSEFSSKTTKHINFERPKSNTIQKILNLNISNNHISLNSVDIAIPNKNLIRDPIFRKNDFYALEFFNEDNQLIYRQGIGDPFKVRLQHIDMENEDHYVFEVPISNFNIVIPRDINPSYISLIRRDNENIYSEASRYILN